MKMIGLNKTLQDFLNIETYQITSSNLKNSGVTSDSILINISQYLFIILIAIALFMMMMILLLIP